MGKYISDEVKKYILDNLESVDKSVENVFKELHSKSPEYKVTKLAFISLCITEILGILSAYEPLREHFTVLNYTGDAVLAGFNAGGGPIGLAIKKIGQKIGSGLVEKIGYYFPEISTVLTSLYITAGELGAEILPPYTGQPNRQDLLDIPAGIIAAVATYFCTRTLAKDG